MMKLKKTNMIFMHVLFAGVSTINWAICKAIDLLEMLKREEEMLSAIKEKQLKGLLMIAHRKLNLAHIFFECSTWMTNVFLQDVIKEINKDNLKICLLTCISLMFVFSSCYGYPKCRMDV
ncbi:unnamed protein product [Brassica napus]|uniref:(rape) hypothetical protein n=1 Tax=Brassica napus TaxID=3708 RepID=A0A816VQ85_BRANA|nr:unnamed protein product [Brassica napus]